MKVWNVVLTSHSNREQRLLREVADLGEFHPSGFREVIIGLVPDIPAFLETMRQRWQEQTFLQEILSTIVPVSVMFPFNVADLLPRLQEHVAPFASEIDGHPFYVRLIRRGHKGEINSQEIEQALDRFLADKISTLGFSPVIDFQGPRYIVVVELIHNQCGVGLLSTELKARYPFIRVK
jgi:tRNA(Ser,Leu) C12 N-acetylase TAN1|uniref:THUMP domain-containing protein n=1 Tax=Desulfobacca acetoxidans TaxID=60893 RepID=A0A7C3V5J5_9BACT